MFLRKQAAVLGATLVGMSLGSAQAATVVEIDNLGNNTLNGAQDVFATDDLIIGYRGTIDFGLGESLIDDESFDFYRLDLTPGFNWVFELFINDADIEAGKNPPAMNLYVDDGFGGAELFSSPEVISTGTFISFLISAPGTYFLGVSGPSYDPSFEPAPFDTNLTYNVRISAVPVPAAAWLMLSALPALARARRRG